MWGHLGLVTTWCHEDNFGLDLRAQLQILASMESQLKELQSQHARCTQDLAMKDQLLCQLTQSSEEKAAQ